MVHVVLMKQLIQISWYICHSYLIPRTLYIFVDIRIDLVHLHWDTDISDFRGKQEIINSPSYNRLLHILCPKNRSHCMKDFERLRRYLLDERFGLVLGGGGAKGFARIGVIQALEDANIPIDCIGGTSMGAFIGTLYAKELNYMNVYTNAKKLAKVARSKLNPHDLTYPFVSVFSGSSLNEAIKSIFKNLRIQNLFG